MGTDKEWTYSKENEEKYIKEQKEWVARNKIKVGGSVRLVRGYVEFERGFTEDVPYDLDDLLEEELFEITCIYFTGIELYSAEFEYNFYAPFFALKPPTKYLRLVTVTEEGYCAIVSKKGVRVGVSNVFSWAQRENLKELGEYVNKLYNPPIAPKFGTLVIEEPTIDLDDEEGIRIYHLTDDHKVRACEDSFFVGCQEVMWSTLDDLLKIRDEFNKK